MGIDIMRARSGALRQLVLDCPSAVLAEALGYSNQAMDRHARRAGSPWASYAAQRRKEAPGAECDFERRTTGRRSTSARG